MIAIDTWWVKARDAAKTLPHTGSLAQDYPAPSSELPETSWQVVMAFAQLLGGKFEQLKPY